MLPEIKLTISQNDKIIETLNKPTDKQQIVKSLEEFQVQANAILTKMIEELGDLSEAGGDCKMDDEDYDIEEDDNSDDDRSPSHGQEWSGENKCKKKKCG